MNSKLAIVALGSNLGDSRRTILEAMARLQNFSDRPMFKSSLWQTAPVNCPPGSPPFVNAVAGLAPRTGETPESLLKKLRELEREFGRPPKKVLNEPRPLDLDLIAFGSETRDTPELVLPHPRAHQRRFVLEPLNEIAPDLILPGQQAIVSRLLAGLPDGENVFLLTWSKPGSNFDWFGFWVHFLFGAIVGGLLGFYIWGQTSSALSSSWIPGLLLISAGAVLGGFIAGCFQEGFWEKLSDCIRWGL
jgi:2-amino-4-hydroxy-6-hydroxymethyldihydropteridine diphosphokinase